MKIKKIIITLLISIVIVFLILFLSGKINFSTKKTSNDKKDNVIEDTFNQDKAHQLVSDIMDKFYTDVFYGHKETYCGEYDNDDIITINYNNYYKSATYNSLSDLKDYLNTYISSELVDSMLDSDGVSKYREQNDKLYCLVHARGALVYDQSNSNYNIQSFDDHNIKAIANVATRSEGDYIDYITVSLELIRINDNWLLSKYEEKQN